LVYLRDVGVRCRHKIQHIWNSMEYKVLRAPAVGGSVYTIAPMNDLQKVKHVHRSLIKNKLSHVIDCPSEPTTETEPPPMDESSLDSKWFALVPERTAAAIDRQTNLYAHTSLPANQPLGTVEAPPGNSEISTRRTTRTNVERHPNHHLPQTPVSNGVFTPDASKFRRGSRLYAKSMHSCVEAA